MKDKMKQPIIGGDYESKGRAFESLRDRHSTIVSKPSKNIFVHLFAKCTPFGMRMRNNLGIAAIVLFCLILIVWCIGLMMEVYR